MKKRSIWIWSLPVIATLLVVWHYTAPMRQSWAVASYRAKHPSEVQVTCAPYLMTNGWGFYILADNKKVIRQDRVPGMQGWHAFATKEDAMKVGQLMIEKIKKGFFPPPITYDEVKGVGAVVN